MLNSIGRFGWTTVALLALLIAIGKGINLHNTHQCSLILNEGKIGTSMAQVVHVDYRYVKFSFMDLDGENYVLEKKIEPVDRALIDVGDKFIITYSLEDPACNELELGKLIEEKVEEKLDEINF